MEFKFVSGLAALPRLVLPGQSSTVGPSFQCSRVQRGGFLDLRDTVFGRVLSKDPTISDLYEGFVG